MTSTLGTSLLQAHFGEHLEYVRTPSIQFNQLDIRSQEYLRQLVQQIQYNPNANVEKVSFKELVDLIPHINPIQNREEDIQALRMDIVIQVHDKSGFGTQNDQLYSYFYISRGQRMGREITGVVELLNFPDEWNSANSVQRP